MCEVINVPFSRIREIKYMVKEFGFNLLEVIEWYKEMDDEYIVG